VAGKKKGGKGGRPTDLTPEAQQKVCQALAAGATREHAAQFAGVGKTTLYAWLKRGRKAKSGRYREFLNAAEAAEAQCAMRNVALVQKAANERDEVTVRETVRADGTVERVTTTRRVFDWGAAAWWLERRYPEDWSANRDRIRELEQQLDDLARRIDHGARGPDAAAGGATGGPARPAPGGG
jgi:hypothetical protein